MSGKPVLRVRRSGALLMASIIGLVGTLAVAGVRWQLVPIMLIPLTVFFWALRAGTDVYPDRLRVRALFGSTTIHWDEVAELAPDQRGRISALLLHGNVLRLAGVTTANLPTVLAASGRPVSSPQQPD